MFRHHDRRFSDITKTLEVSSVWYKTKFGSEKFWLPELVTFRHRLPKLVDKISSQFQHLVNTGLDVGSLVKWLPIKVANPSKID